jgi:hypothetical protein
MELELGVFATPQAWLSPSPSCDSDWPPGKVEASGQASSSLSPPPCTPQMYSVKSSLEAMDALELDFRMRLAEVQRQYKEKQRELVKLQRRRDSG